jgi:hypothetical protein
MMKATKASRLFTRFIAALPERQRKTKQRSLDQNQACFTVGKPEAPTALVPTLDPKTHRPVSPQLRDWHAVVGMLVEESWKYLSCSERQATVRNRRLRSIVATHREHWDNSAPMQFPNAQLSIFALIGDLDDGDLIYLVWPQPTCVEPEIWSYVGQSETRYKTLLRTLLGYWRRGCAPHYRSIINLRSSHRRRRCIAARYARCTDTNAAALPPRSG